MPRRSRIVAVIVALLLALSAVDEAKAQEDEDSSAITDLFTGLLKGVGGQVQQAAVGWALSQIGLAGGSSSALNEIAAELKAIDQDLKNINATLIQMLNAIDNQTCVGTETQASLTKAVDNITTLYTQYQTQFLEPAQKGDPVIPSQLSAWLAAVFDSQNGIAANLTAINNALYTNPSSVITECIVSITQSYVSGQGPQEHMVDDRPYYAPIINTLNYYYGVQVQGATVLVEALHLEACKAAAVADPNLHCDFTTASTSTPASDASTICEEPTGTVKTYCDEATEVVTDPLTLTGMYERVLAQLIYAGAPYSNDKIGLLGGSSLLFAKSLEDFTNQAYQYGGAPQPCPLPLTSAAPCGWTVGYYNQPAPTALIYGALAPGYYAPWTFASAPQMLQLLTAYNNKSTAGGINSSGTLAQYLQSIGFVPPESGHGWIVLFNHTGRNGYTDEQTICFMDTSILRSQSKQPFCDGLSGAGGTDALIYAVAPNNDYYDNDPFTQSLASGIPVFYQAQWHVSTGHWIIPPSWAIYPNNPPPATLAASKQFHWPVFDVSILACTVRAQGPKNPGGQYTMCGKDLQAYLDALLPPPNTATTALTASADVTLDVDDRNRNRGAGSGLELVPFEGQRSHDLVVRFDAEAIERFLEGGELGAATLRLTVPDGASDWEAWHQAVTVRPLTAPFVEGNGERGTLDRGTGTGATWHCAEDADVSDWRRACELHWPRSRWMVGRFGGASQLEAEVVFDRPGWMSVRMSWDVTDHVMAGIDAWILRSKRKGDPTYLTFHSREGAARLRDPALAPRLFLER